MGEQLRVGAHLAELRRTRAGDFQIAQAYTLEQLHDKVAAQFLDTMLLPPDAALQRMPFVHLSVGEARRVCQGMAVALPECQSKLTDGQTVRMRDEEGNLIAVGSYEGQLLHPRVVIAAEKLPLT